MKYSDIKSSVLSNFSIGNKLVPFIKGRPGGGKSALARDIVSSLGINPERVTEFNPSLRDPVDIMGVPRTDNDVAKWIPMPEFWRIRDDGTDQPCALIVEELSDAPVPMQNPMCLSLIHI
jgi:MoxR-like ATPase